MEVEQAEIPEAVEIPVPEAAPVRRKVGRPPKDPGARPNSDSSPSPENTKSEESKKESWRQKEKKSKASDERLKALESLSNQVSTLILLMMDPTAKEEAKKSAAFELTKRCAAAKLGGALIRYEAHAEWIGIFVGVSCMGWFQVKDAVLAMFTPPAPPGGFKDAKFTSRTVPPDAPAPPNGGPRQGKDVDTP